MIRIPAWPENKRRAAFRFKEKAMTHDSFIAKALRFIGIVLMALTAGLTLMGGAGTSCVALNPTGFGPAFAGIAPYQWLYILFVLAGITIGVLGIRATVVLIKGREKAYRDALVTLIAGTVLGLVHIAVSRALRNGKSMPADMIVYFTVLTLIVFLLFRLPGIWQGVDFSAAKAKKNRPAAGASAVMLGLMSLNIQNMMKSTHMLDGVNYADVFHTAMLVIGLGLMLSGALLFVNWEKALAGIRASVPALKRR